MVGSPTCSPAPSWQHPASGRLPARGSPGLTAPASPAPGGMERRRARLGSPWLGSARLGTERKGRQRRPSVPGCPPAVGERSGNPAGRMREGRRSAWGGRGESKWLGVFKKNNNKNKIIKTRRGGGEVGAGCGARKSCSLVRLRPLRQLRAVPIQPRRRRTGGKPAASCSNPSVPAALIGLPSPHGSPSPPAASFSLLGKVIGEPELHLQHQQQQQQLRAGAAQPGGGGGARPAPAPAPTPAPSPSSFSARRPPAEPAWRGSGRLLGSGRLPPAPTARLGSARLSLPSRAHPSLAGQRAGGCQVSAHTHTWEAAGRRGAPPHLPRDCRDGDAGTGRAGGNPTAPPGRGAGVAAAGAGAGAG